jgi:glycosyltransferase involved in cell wall biosynthesis
VTGIFYDAQGAQTPHHPERGIARYVTEFGLALGAVAPGVVEAVVYDPSLPLTGPFERLRATAPVLPNDHPSVAAARVYHIGSPFELGRPGAVLWPLGVRRSAARVVSTLYDLIPLIYPVDYLPNPFDRLLYRRSVELVRACDALVAISQASADDAHRLLGIPRSRLRVIGAGANDGFAPPTAPLGDVVRALATTVPGVRPGYVFLPTGMDARKNWEGALDAYSRLPPALRHAHQLVLTCRVDDRQRATVDARAAQLGVGDDLLVTGVVDDVALVRLYQAARLVLFPSRYEGFGLPPLEARLCGAPVVCGDNSSLREVITDPVARFDADDPGAVAAALLRALTDDAFRARLLESPTPAFSWNGAARRTVELYTELAQRPRTRRRRRVGVVVSRSAPVIDAVPGVTWFGPRDPLHPTISSTNDRALLPWYDTCGMLDSVLYVAGPDGLDDGQRTLRRNHPGVVVPEGQLAAWLREESDGTPR